MDNQTPITPSAPPVDQKPPKPFFANKLFLLTIAIIVFLILGLVGYQILGIGKDQCSALLCLRLGKSSENLTPAKSPTSDPTASWKTYDNNEYGFSIKYPASLISEDRTRTNSPFTLAIIDKSQEYSYEKGKINAYMGIVAVKPFPQTLENYINDPRNNLIKTGIEKVGSNVFLIAKDKKNLGMEPLNQYFIKNGDIGMAISNSSFPIEQNLFNQILSTLKFTQ